MRPALYVIALLALAAAIPPQQIAASLASVASILIEALPFFALGFVCKRAGRPDALQKSLHDSDAAAVAFSGYFTMRDCRDENEPRPPDRSAPQNFLYKSRSLGAASRGPYRSFAFTARTARKYFGKASRLGDLSDVLSLPVQDVNFHLTLLTQGEADQFSTSRIGQFSKPLNRFDLAQTLERTDA